MTNRLVFSLLIGTGLVTTAVAEPPKEGAGAAARAAGMLEYFDVDGDGRITEEEVTAKRSERFDRVDANGDGVIGSEEFAVDLAVEQEKRRERMRTHMFGRLDADSDGGLTREEFTAGSNRMFDRFDANDDGMLDETELSQGRHGRRGHRGAPF